MLWGSGTITIGGETKIKITLTGQKEIWPYLPPQSDGKSRGADRPGYNPYTSLKIKINNGEQPVPNKTVTITIKRIEGTGGHDHLNPLSLDKSGQLFIGNKKGNPINATTDSNGEVVVDKLLSSQVSGIYIIEAALESKPEIKDTTSLIVKVTGLLDFGIILSKEWYLTGSLPQHLLNHFCDQEMGLKLASAIMDFYEWNIEYSKLLNKTPIKLLINDMSLIWGGAFDIPGQWGLYSNHSFHRIGLSVDINRTGMSNEELFTLTSFMKKQNGSKYPESTIHYGFLGGN